MSDFVHLHVHSHYSLLDGGNRIRDLVGQARAHGMDSIALTDHGNLFGALEFYRAAKDAGIRPILGMEAYIAPGSRRDRTAARQSDASYHLLLLAMNETGWRNLIKLSSRAYLEGFYYKPRVDRELLQELNAGLVATSACLGGEVPTALAEGEEKKARRIAGEYAEIFGKDRFFIEIQKQGETEQDRVNPMLARVARELGVGLVGTNDVHFLRRGDKKAHEVLTCISLGKKLDEPGNLAYSPELYLKSGDEMAAAFADWPEAVANTRRIAEMCRLDLNFKQKHLPVFHTPDGTPPPAHLRQLAWEGLARRFGDREPPEEYRKRLDWELQVIEQKGYSSYFLIVHDFVSFARAHEIPAAPRGSGVATLLGYALGIADIDPLRYGLLFERFTDPQRQEDPDIDIDMCQDGRERVLQYVREKYGHVAQIITYGTLKARAALKDVGRVLGVPLDQVNRLTKLVPEGPKASLHAALGQGTLAPDEQDLASPELQALYEQDPATREMVDYGLQLEGLARHAGVHAAGVVVCDAPLETLVPLYRQADSADVITQWDGPTCEKAGLMKMDILGLRTLTILQRTRELVRARTGRDIDPDALPLDDPQVYEIFQRGDTEGLFQFESEGMKNVLKRMRPNRIEDLIAANAMYRPGPMKLIPDYCARKAGRQPVPSVHPLVDGLLTETYGIMCYQEQVMQVVNRLGQIPLNRALTLIKAISKKKQAVIADEKPHFLKGAQANGIAAAKAEELFDLILQFAGYGFNKAHSTRYAIVAYQTAYFKRYHPAEFLAATLTYECGDQDKVVQYIAEAQRMGVTVAPPDINACGAAFAVDGALVRFGLMAVKGVGQAAVDAIVAARQTGGPFRDLFEFCRRVDLRAVNRLTIEALIKCGAFDRAGGGHRRALVAAVDQAVQSGQRAATDRARGQASLFDLAGGAAPADRLPELEPWSRGELLAAEKETLGFFVTAHPLQEFAAEARGLAWPAGFSLAQLESLGPHAPVAAAVMVSGVKLTVTKNGRSAGQKMAMLQLEDLTGRCEAVAFSETYKKVSATLAPGALLLIRGEADRSRDRPNIIVNDAIPLAEAASKAAGGLQVRLQESDLADEARLKELADALRRHPGPCPVRLRFQLNGAPCRSFVLTPGSKWSVRLSPPLLQQLRQLAGPAGIGFDPTPPPERKTFRPNEWSRA